MVASLQLRVLALLLVRPACAASILDQDELSSMLQLKSSRSLNRIVADHGSAFVADARLSSASLGAEELSALVSYEASTGVYSLSPSSLHYNLSASEHAEIDTNLLRNVANAVSDHETVHLQGGEFYVTTNPGSVPSGCELWECAQAAFHLQGKENVFVKGSTNHKGFTNTNINVVGYDRGRGDQNAMAIFSFFDSKDIRMKNVRMRMDVQNPSHFVARVLEKWDSSLKIQVLSGFPAVPADSNRQSKHCSSSHPNNAFYAEHFLRLDSNRRVTEWEYFTKSKSYRAVQNLDGTYTVTFCSGSTSTSNFLQDDYLLVQHQKRSVWGISFKDVDGLNLHTIQFGNIAGAGVRGKRIKRLVINRLKADPRQNHQSVWGIWWQTLIGNLFVRGYGGSGHSIRKLTIEQATDDYLNFHTSMIKLTEWGGQDDYGNRCFKEPVNFAYWRAGPRREAQEDDLIRLYTADGNFQTLMRYKGKRRINGQGDINYRCFEHVSGTAWTNLGNAPWYIASDKWMPKPTGRVAENPGNAALQIREVVIRNTRSRGVLKGDGVFMSNVVVERDLMSGIVILGEHCAWGEGVAASNIVLRNLNFTQAALRYPHHPAPIRIETPGCDGFEGQYGTDHHDITIQQAIFADTPSSMPPLVAHGVSGLHLQTFQGCNAVVSDTTFSCNGNQMAASIR